MKQAPTRQAPKAKDTPASAASSAPAHLARRASPQRAGNQAVQRTLGSGGLRISQPGDASEREARRMADQAPPTDTGTALSFAAGGSEQPLSPLQRGRYEAYYSTDLGGVRIHTGAQADASARALNALAYTIGQDVVFANGSYAPHTPQGDRLLAHELAHVRQQAQPGAGLAIQRQEATFPWSEQPVCMAEEASSGVCAAEPQTASEPEAMQCSPESEEGGVCEQLEDQVLSSPGPGPDAIEFENIWLDSETAFLRAQLSSLIARDGFFGAEMFQYRFERRVLFMRQSLADMRFQAESPYGAQATTPEMVETEQRLAMMEAIQGQMPAVIEGLKTEYNAFGQLVKAAATVRLTRNIQALGMWLTFITESITPQQMMRQTMATQERELLMQVLHAPPTIGPHITLDLYEQRNRTESPYQRIAQENILTGETNGGCQTCHDKIWADNMDYRDRHYGEEDIAPAVRMRDLVLQEQASPTPRPGFAEDQGEGEGVPDWSFMQLGDRPASQTVAWSIDQIRPFLKPLGDSGYRVLPDDVINRSMSAEELVIDVTERILSRQENYRELISRINEPNYDYLQLIPLVQALLPLQSEDIQRIVMGESARSEEAKEARANAEMVGGILALLLIIFPPTAPLGLAMAAGLGIYGLYTGYEDFQQGYTYNLGIGGGVFSPEQEQAADMLMISGLVTMGLSLLDIREVGMAMGTIRITRVVRTGPGKLDPVELIEAEANGSRVLITDANTSNPNITGWDADGSLRVRQSVTEAQSSNIYDELNIRQLRQRVRSDREAFYELERRYREMPFADLERIVRRENPNIFNAAQEGNPANNSALLSEADVTSPEHWYFKRLSERHAGFSTPDVDRTLSEELRSLRTRLTEMGAPRRDLPLPLVDEIVEAAQRRGQSVSRQELNRVTGGTAGVAQSDIPALEGQVLHGGSPATGRRAEIRVPGEEGVLRPTSPVRQAQHHAEEDLALQIRRQIVDLPPEALDNRRVFMLIEQEPCSGCAAGLHSSSSLGVLGQLSREFPNLTIEVRNLRTSELYVIRGGRRIN